MNNGICIVPVSPMRAEAAHRSEMVSQALFGEHVSTLEIQKEWLKIKSTFDGYEGWCQRTQIMFHEAESNEEILLSTGWASKIRINGQDMRIPFGSTISEFTGSVLRMNVSYKDESVVAGSLKFTEKNIRELSSTYLNTAYLWGGKSVFGVDCSGFCQTVFKFLGITLLRDAYLQATQGEAIGFLQEAVCGDLAFFDNAEGKITHVGIMLNNHTIIHSSGRVRVDSIDNMGIISSDTNLRTHNLRLIKRYKELS